MNKVTIICPVYKTEDQLRMCIQSILTQTYPHLEILLIDNGGTDQCPHICDEYAQKDSRVKVVHLPQNVGIAGARNVGIKLATGDYLTFIDSDDEFFPTAIESMLNGMLDRNAELVAGTIIEETPYPPRFGFKSFQNTSGDVQSMVNVLKDANSFCNIWNKLFSTKVIHDFNISFSTKVAWYDDFCFVTEYCQHITTIATVSDTVYKYYSNWSPTQGSKAKPNITSTAFVFRCCLWHLKNDIVRAKTHREKALISNNIVNNFFGRLVHRSSDKDMFFQGVQNYKYDFLLVYLELKYFSVIPTGLIQKIIYILLKMKSGYLVYLIATLYYRYVPRQYRYRTKKSETAKT